MKNDYTIVGDVVMIDISTKNGKTLQAMIDKEDLDKLKPFKRLNRIGGRSEKKYIYAYAKDPKDNCLLHRIVMNTPKKHKCIFKSGDSFDCRKGNLVNMAEVRTYSRNGKPNKHKYIWYRADSNKYHVSVRENKKPVYLGVYTTMAEAEKVRDKYLTKAKQ